MHLAYRISLNDFTLYFETKCQLCMSNDLENIVTEYLISEHSLSSVICADLIYHARCLSSSDNNIQSLESIEI